MAVGAKKPHTSVVCIKFREEVFFQLFVESLFVSYEFYIFIGEFMPGCWIRDSRSGMEKNRIRDPHPGSATQLIR